MQNERTSFRTNADENLTKDIQDREDGISPTNKGSLSRCVSVLEEKVGGHLQYTRRETLEFHGIH